MNNNPTQHQQKIPGTPDGGGFQRLQALVAHLRSPAGCPWDRVQTLETLRPSIVEEAFELVEAIAELSAMDAAPGRSGKRDEVLSHIAEELGDVLLVVSLMASVLSTDHGIDIEDALSAVNEKIVRRHPHVFASDAPIAAADTSAETAVGRWESIKRNEEGRTRTSEMDEIPAMPAIERAAKIQHRAAKVGFDWPTAEPVFAKVREEVVELEDLVASDGTLPGDLRRRARGELGDILFAVINLARKLDIDPAGALEETNERFAHRFRHMERRFRSEGKAMNDQPLEVLDAAWDEAKEAEASEEFVVSDGGNASR